MTEELKQHGKGCPCVECVRGIGQVDRPDTLDVANRIVKGLDRKINIPGEYEE